ncbi:hypothetical protein [Streptomyces mesophilus]|uniref:hypothetical protein n=1 Tax=Streptomyces mesophilus TaxID=1775132 RepID=UPI003322C4F8
MSHDTGVPAYAERASSLNAAWYVRVSTGEQRNGYGIAAQKSAIERFVAHEPGLTLVGG